jgi:outer membrane autotransporter protein
MKNKVFLILAIWPVFAFPAQAQTWSATPASGNWNTAANWTPTVVPNSQSAHVTLTASSVTQLFLSADTDVADINKSSSIGYSLDCGSYRLDFWSGGIGSWGDPLLTLRGNGEIGFHNNSGASYSIIIMESGGRLSFFDTAHGGDHIIVNEGACFDISGLTASGTYVDSLSGGGDFYLGSKRLSVYGDPPCTITGNIMDGGLAGGTGGYLAVSGDLALAGTNLYSGGTSIAGRLRVGSPGALGTGPVFNAGTLETYGNPGAVSIQGEFTNDHFATLRLGLGGTGEGEYDRLAVSGEAHLSSELTVFAYDGFQPQSGDTFTILTAQKVNGTFSMHVTNPFDGVRLRLRYLPEEALLQVVPESFEAFAKTPNEAAFAHTLDRLYTEKEFDVLISDIIALPFSDFPAAFHSVAPEELTCLFRIGFAGLDALSEDITGRLHALRFGATAQGPAWIVNRGKGNMEAAFSTPAKPDDNASRGGFFTASGAAARVKGDSDAAGYDFNMGHLTLAGIDYRLGDDLLGGGFLGYSRADADLEAGGHATANGGRFGLYGSYYPGGFHVDFIAVGGLDFFDTQRIMLGQTMKNHSTGVPFAYALGGGYDLRAGDFALETRAGFRYNSVELFEMKERSQKYSMDFHSQGENSLQSEIRLLAMLGIRMGRVELTPRAGAAWRHEHFLARDRLKVGLYYNYSDYYMVQGPEIGRDAVDLSAGLNFNWAQQFFVFAEYRTELGRTNFESEGLACGASFEF